MDKQIAYSTLKIKAVNEDKREFSGIASTISPDRVNDVLIPKGAKFTLPIPFLWQHDHQKPIGEIYEAKVTDNGIEVKGRIKNVSAPSQLAARLEEAWVSLKEGLVRGLSVGFKPVKYSFLEDSDGVQFDEWDWYELSAVTIGCNAEATITQIKSLDRQTRAALGTEQEKRSFDEPSGVSEKTKTVKLLETKEKKMSLSEKLKGFQDELKTKNAKLVELAEKSAEEGETFDEADQEEFDTLEAEVKTLEAHIKRLEVAQKAAMASAKPVTEEDGQKSEKASAARGEQPVFAKVKTQPKLKEGIGFARLARCKALAKMTGESASEVARQNYGEDSSVYGILKAAVAAGTTTDNTWAGPLVGDESTVYADFVEYLRPMTILGKMGTDGIPGVRNVPFRTRLISQTSGGEGYWVGEGNAKPLTKFDFAGTTLEPLKVANIAVVTMETLRDSSPSAEVIVRDELAKALAARLDIDFLDPDKAASTGVSPASVTNGVTAITSTGNDADSIRADITALLQTYIAANNTPTNGVLIMSSQLALAVSMLQNPLGQSEFPGLNMFGGTLLGFPVITSEYLTGFTETAGGFVFMVNASDIWLGDEGGVSVDMSDQASLQMDNAPDNPSDASTVMVSLWQRNLVGFRAERTINWAKRRSSAVAVLDGVNWGQPSS